MLSATPTRTDKFAKFYTMWWHMSKQADRNNSDLNHIGRPAAACWNRLETKK